MPILSEIEQAFADKIAISLDPYSTARLIGLDINKIAHSDGRMLSLEEKKEIAYAIRRKLANGEVDTRAKDFIGFISRFSFDNDISDFQGITQVILDQFE